MRVLVACEFSGVVREAFRRRGHDAYSCDLLPAEDGSPYHIQSDVRDVLHDGSDMMIAHPPCTYLCLVSLPHLHRNLARWEAMQQAVEFFLQLLHAPVPRVCVENPVPHWHAARLIGVRYTQIINPYQFGDVYIKPTALWLRGLPPLLPTHARPAQVVSLHNSVFKYPREEWWKHRSRTSRFVAEAMATQWG